jgi:hypothetical protein
MLSVILGFWLGYVHMVTLVLLALISACKQESGGWNYGHIFKMEGEGELCMHLCVWSIGCPELFSLWLHISLLRAAGAVLSSLDAQRFPE